MFLIKLFHSFKVLFFLSFLSVPFSVFADEHYSLNQFHHNSKNYTENRIFLFSLGRSGTHWTLYILKHFTKRPFAGSDNKYRNPFDQQEDKNLPFIHHDHDTDHFLANFKNQFFSFACPNKKKDKILIILRNPLDTLLRLHASFDEALNHLTKGGETSLFCNLHYLEKWPKANSYVIYYEDLLDNPKEEIAKLLKFTEVSTNGLSDFIANLEQHSNKTLSFYDHHHKSYTKGKDRTFYQRKYTSDQLKTLVKLLKEIDPGIWEKYLKRYEL